MIRVCSRCHMRKPLTEFHRAAKRPSRYCKPCANESAREWRRNHPERVAERTRLYQASHPERYQQYAHRARLKKRGLTAEAYDAILAAQDGVCAICRHRQPRRRLCVDHNHHTGKNRGLLCDTCNRALGLFGDDMCRLAAAITYLEAHA